MSEFTPDESAAHAADMATFQACSRARDCEGAVSASESAKARILDAGVLENRAKAKQAMDAVERALRVALSGPPMPRRDGP